MRRSAILRKLEFDDGRGKPKPQESLPGGTDMFDTIIALIATGVTGIGWLIVVLALVGCGLIGFHCNEPMAGTLFIGFAVWLAVETIVFFWQDPTRIQQTP